MNPHSSLYKNSLKSITLLVLMVLGGAAIFAPHSTGVSVQWPNVSRPENPETTREAFGRLPLSFEINQGQTDSGVKFLSRSHGYGIFLTDDGAAFSFDETSTALHMGLKGANTSPRIAGVDQLPGKVNYLVGNKPTEWRTNIPTYARVRYEQIYPGVDLVYYGNQRLLEFDFVVQAGASSRQIRLVFDGAGKLRLNSRGDLILQSGARTITLLRPVAYQNIGNKRREVSARYLLKRRGEVGFQVGKYDKTQQLIIDPVLVYSTFLGGADQDQGNSIAVDSSGNAYIAGQTASLNFPTGSPLQAAKGSGPDAFVAKINATGSALVYSTFLGGGNTDAATSIAIDNAGNAYLTGQTSSTDFPVLNALHSTFTGSVDAFVAELNSSGSALVYSTYLGGRSGDIGNSIAVDSAGNAYVTGSTSSRDFPTSNPLQPNRTGNSIFKSTDSAVNWAAADSGLIASIVNDFVFQPGNSSVIYAATDAGVFKTTDSGANWSSLSVTMLPSVNQLALDPTNPAVIYAATSGGMFKSTDGGINFTLINNGLNSSARTILVDPVTPTTLYATVGGSPFFKSVDGGANWTIRFITGVGKIDGLTLDPNTPATIYAATDDGVFKSTDSAGSWTASNTGLPGDIPVNSIAIDHTNNLLYAATVAGIFKSTNGAGSWTNINGNMALNVSSVAVDPTNTSVLYVATFPGPHKTTDGGTTWNISNNGYSNSIINSLVVNPTQTSTVFIGAVSGLDAFVTKLSAGGTSQVYSTFLGGSGSDAGNAIALDASGNAYITGLTTSSNFPTANALQAAKGDSDNGNDAFITKLNASGSAFVYSTFLGADGRDVGRAIAVDATGNAYVAGSTNSLFFPVVNAFQPLLSGFANDAFITKVNAAGSALVYSTYLGGDANEDCFAIAVDAAGSAYVTGNTSSLNFPTLGALQPERSGFSGDAFVTSLAPNGSSLNFSTYLGGINSDTGRGIAVDSSKNVYVVGVTVSTNFPTVNPLQPGPGGSTDVFVAKLSPAPEVEVTVTDSPDPVNFGSNLTYTITVRNNGEITATGVTLTDTLPTGAGLVSANSTAGTCSGTTSINCNIGTLNSGATATVTIVVTPPAISFIHNTAVATINETDAIPANNTVTTETIVVFADLAIAKKAAQNLVAPGSSVTYSLTVSNKGGVPIDVNVTDQLPEGMTLIRCAATGNGVCGGFSNVVSVNFPEIQATAAETVLLTVGVSATATEGTIITNTAFASSPVPDPDTSNNSSTASVTVAAVPILQKSNGIIAFGSQRHVFSSTVPSGIYTVKPDATDEKLFPGIPTNTGAEEPEWSPDGSRLAFQVTNFAVSPLITEISVINADGSGLLKLVDDATDFNRGITWSPNGSQIAYIGRGGPGVDTIRTIHIANTDGTGSYRLPNSPSFLSAVDWSPDGTKFVYSNGQEIFVINADGTGQTKLTSSQQTLDGASNDDDPRWSPDGTKILFTRFTNNSFTTHVMNADGSNLRKLNNFNSFSPSWSPDGLSIVMSQSSDICTVNLDNTDFKCVINNNQHSFIDFSPSWQKLPNPNPTPTPTPVPTFSLSGKITTDSQSFIAQIELDGPVFARINNDVNGNYEFVNLPAGEYTLTPISIFHSFNPPNRTVTITNANITGLDFVGTFVPASISGHVKDNNGNPLAGIKITLGAQGAIPEDLLTDANGFYSFTDLPRHLLYIVVPDPFSPYDFVPSQKVIQGLTVSEVVDFVGTKQPTHVLAGRVVDAITGQGINAVRVDLAQDNTHAGFSFTDANGNVSFGERKENHSYSVSVSDGPLLVFEPKPNPSFQFAQIQLPNLTTDQNVTFTASKRNTLNFASATPSVNESSASLQITVNRSGDVSSPATVTFATADTAGLAACSVVNGKASERCDYGSAAGTLRFAAGETSKSFIIPIVHDVNVEGNETFTTHLANAVGAQLGSTANVTVTITDDDSTAATQNPIDGVEPFVTQQYIDFLGRLPDTIGFTNWVATLTFCPNGGFGENDNPSCDRVHVSAGFFLSDEFRGRGYWAYRFYEVGFDRRPSYAEFVPDMSQVGGPQSPESEQLSKTAYTDAFVKRSEFTSRYNLLDNFAYVNALEQNAEITLSNKAELIAELDRQQKTRGQVLREIVESKAVEDQLFIRAFVAMQYFGYLRRDPDTIGYNNWITTLTADPSNFRHMIFGFIFSTEYRGRFGP